MTNDEGDDPSPVWYWASWKYRFGGGGMIQTNSEEEARRFYKNACEQYDVTRAQFERFVRIREDGLSERNYMEQYPAE